MRKVILIALASVIASSAFAQDAKPKKQKATTTQTQKPAAPKNEYGTGCKNQTASIMSGTCVN